MHITNFDKDEFHKTSHEPYLSHRQSTNLLNTMILDEPTRQQICKQFIESLKSQGPKILKTEFHLAWAMECLGYAFSLPTTESHIISIALSIYKDWISPSFNTPEILRNNLAKYQKEIIGHISLVFKKKDNLQRHEKVCEEVLAFISFFIRLQLCEETWESLLYMLMITFDELIKKHLKLAEILSGSYLKVLFEAWIRAKCYNKDLWTRFKKRINTWIDCKSLISHWASVTLSLTKTISSMIYCETSKEIEIVFDPGSSLSQIIRIPLNEEEKVYFWYRFTELVIDETKSSVKMNPEIHSALSGSISSILNYFLSVCSRFIESFPIKSQPTFSTSLNSSLRKILNEFSAVQEKYIQGLCRLPIPSINSLMDLFGNWLFYHAQIDPAYDSFGKSETLSILCKIFSFAQGPAKPEYSKTFFTILLSNVCDGDKFVVGEILKNSAEIVKYGVDAVDFLLRPDGFIQSLALYLCDKETEKTLRYPCYLILACMSIVPNVFRIKQISKNIVDIFVEAIWIEGKNRNFNVMVWSICGFLSTFQDDQDSMQRIICVMVDRLEDMEFNEKNLNKYSDLLEVLTVLPNLINKKLLSAQIIKRNIEKFLNILPKRGKLQDASQTKGILQAILNWLICFPVSLTSPEIKFEFTKILEGLKKKFKDLASYILSSIFNTVHYQYYMESGANLESLLMNSEPQVKNKFIKFGDNIWSFNSKDSHIQLVLRNAVGLFSWKLSIILDKIPKKYVYELPVLDVRTEKIQKNDLEIDYRLDQDLTDAEKKTLKKFKVFYCVQEARSKTTTTKKCIEKNIMVHETIEPKFERMLIAQLGLLDKEFINDLLPLSFQEFDLLSHSLDSIGEKVIITFPIIYLENPEDSEKTIFKKNKKYSLGFSKFIKSLGTVLTPSTNLTHFSHLVRNYEKTIYKNFHLFESFAYLPEFLHLGVNNGFQEYVGLSSVIVIWNQMMSDSFSKKVPSILNRIDLEMTTVIVLNAFHEKLTRVSVSGKMRKKGPLVNQMIVPNEVLGKLLNFTVFNYKNCEGMRESVWKKRKEVFETYEKTESEDFGNLLNSLFRL